MVWKSESAPEGLALPHTGDFHHGADTAKNKAKPTQTYLKNSNDTYIDTYQYGPLTRRGKKKAYIGVIVLCEPQ